jgi:transcriptional regulator with XRE-family HTH domain
MAVVATPLPDAKSLFGQRLREAREQAGLSNRQLAELLATSERGTDVWRSEVETLRRNLRRWQRGHNKPGADVVLAWARHCGVDPRSFSGEPRPVVNGPALEALAGALENMNEALMVAVRLVRETTP